MQKNNSFYLLVLLSLLFGFLVLHGCFTLYTQEGFEDKKNTNESVKKEKQENNLDKISKKTKNQPKKIKVKTLPF